MVCSTFVSFQDSVNVTVQHLRAAGKSTAASPYPALDMEIKDQSGFHYLYRKPLQTLSPPLQVPFNGSPRPTARPPICCLPPVLAFSKRKNGCGSDQSGTASSVVYANSSAAFSHSLPQEVEPNDRQHKVSFISPARMQVPQGFPTLIDGNKHRIFLFNSRIHFMNAF